jgi:NhaP-type Na+/H+ or K+/H+ antiporter
MLIGGANGEIISKLSIFYIGYSFSLGGAVIGFLWGFVDGFVCGFLVAWIYNMANKFFSKPKTT